jgi:hypothetical protein
LTNVSPTTYPELSSVLGGASAVPDLRGQFLRGVGGNSAAIGVKQTDATYIRDGEAQQTLYGVRTWRINAGYEDGGAFEHISANTLVVGHWNGGYYPATGSSVNLNFKINTPGVTETRPVNVAVRYLIRALP